MTCWRRLRDWQEADLWEKLHQALLDRLGRADQIDWSRASVDSQSIPAVGVGKKGSLPPARIRRIAEKEAPVVRARSAILWSTGEARPLPFDLPEPTPTTQPSSKN